MDAVFTEVTHLYTCHYSPKMKGHFSLDFKLRARRFSGFSQLGQRARHIRFYIFRKNAPPPLQNNTPLIHPHALPTALPTQHDRNKAENIKSPPPLPPTTPLHTGRQARRRQTPPCVPPVALPRRGLRGGRVTSCSSRCAATPMCDRVADLVAACSRSSVLTLPSGGGPR